MASETDVIAALVARIKSCGGSCQNSILGECPEFKEWRSQFTSTRQLAKNNLNSFLKERPDKFNLSKADFGDPKLTFMVSLADPVNASNIKRKGQRKIKKKNIPGAETTVKRRKRKLNILRSNLPNTAKKPRLDTNPSNTENDQEDSENLREVFLGVFACELYPSQIKFSHDDFRSTFSDGKQLRDTFIQLHTGSLRPTEIPRIQVVHHEGSFVTLSNRRLAVFRLWAMHADLQATHVPCAKKIVVDIVAKPQNFARKYSTQCKGTSANLRNTPFRVGETLAQTTLDPFRTNWESSNNDCASAHVDEPRQPHSDTASCCVKSASHVVDHLERLVSLRKAGFIESHEFERAKALILGI